MGLEKTDVIASSTHETEIRNSKLLILFGFVLNILYFFFMAVIITLAIVDIYVDIEIAVLQFTLYLFNFIGIVGVILLWIGLNNLTNHLPLKMRNIVRKIQKNIIIFGVLFHALEYLWLVLGFLPLSFLYSAIFYVNLIVQLAGLFGFFLVICDTKILMGEIADRIPATKTSIYTQFPMIGSAIFIFIVFVTEYSLYLASVTLPSTAKIIVFCLLILCYLTIGVSMIESVMKFQRLNNFEISQLKQQAVVNAEKLTRLDEGN